MNQPESRACEGQVRAQAGIHPSHIIKSSPGWISLLVQVLRLHASTAGGVGLIPGLRSSACCKVQPKKKSSWGHPKPQCGWETSAQCQTQEEFLARSPTCQSNTDPLSQALTQGTLGCPPSPALIHSE